MEKRGLYANPFEKINREKVRLMMNFISLCDGDSSLLQIAEDLNLPMWDLYDIIEDLKFHKLIEANE